ncbi:UDP-galactopyranose mutase family [Verrucomicrobiia bacterium DG1235]|nr:UDP-galactopyranose mutase family [Verrucomicrobiae bacterium DG1235]
MNQFCSFNSYVHRGKSLCKGKLYSLPINLSTFYEVYGVKTPDEARMRLEEVRVQTGDVDNLEDWCLGEIGPELYELLVKGYTIKQWRKDPRELSASIIKRLPVRLNFDDNYFRDRFQGIPIGGYTRIFERLLEGVSVELEVDFMSDRDGWMSRFDHIIYTGPIDAFFDYSEGLLEYRSLRFENEILDTVDYQGASIINCGDIEVPYTRTIEHKHFDLDYSKARTLVTKEYPQDWYEGRERYYPISTSNNAETYQKYRELAVSLDLPVTFGGRLGQYKYFDMHQVVAAALTKSRQLLARDFKSFKKEN